MGVLVELLVVAVAVAIVAAIVATYRRDHAAAARRWSVDTWTLPDGTLVVGVRRPDGEERVIRRLAPDLDPADLTAELRLAREEAQLAVDELNRL